MAHHIEENDSMFFVGKTPWHGMGTELPRLATAAEAIEAANLSWHVYQEPVLTSAGVELSDKRLNIRSDTGQPLGVVGTQYKILDNVDAFAFFDAVTMDPNGPKYETAGSLWNGRKVWMLAKMPDCIEVAPGDIVDPYILLSNTHDGSGAVRILETPVRVVCQNTLNAAHASQGRNIRIRHSGDMSFKVSEVQDALGIIRANFEATAELYKALARDYPTPDEVETVLNRLFPETKSDRSTIQKGRVRTLAAAGIGNGNKAVEGTAWALYNGITELTDHHANKDSKRADARDMRLNSFGMGSGLDFKADALQTIREVCLN